MTPRELEEYRMIFVGGAHALFLLRVGVARRAASTERALDLAAVSGLIEKT